MRQYWYTLWCIVFLCLSMICGMICFFLHNHTIDFSSLQQDVGAKPSVLLDHKGRVWGQFQIDKRSYVSLESIPEHLVQAFLVTEDRSFFVHPGISFRGILRSMIVNLIRGKRVQGASTITQQLVRLKFLHSKKTFTRKFKEQVYAILVEREWSKEQILEAYLNNVYFGYGIYGVQAAAQRFWGIDVSDISLDQSAVLASVMKSPRVYSPISEPENVLARRNLIVQMMYENKLINQQQKIDAQEQPLLIKDADTVMIAPHAKEMIRQMLEKQFGKDDLYRKGFIIQTTLDLDVQLVAQEAFEQHVKSLQRRLHANVDGGLVTLDTQTGAIRAMIGGADFKKSKWNRATQAVRQMGSVFKVFVYGAALEQGLNFWDVEIDEPFELTQHGSVWRPENYNRMFLGGMTRAFALSHSNNIVAIKTLLKTGIEHIIDLARRCHITAQMPSYPSLALGCLDVTVLETAAAFNVIPNYGWYVQPHIIAWVKDEFGQKVYKTTPRKTLAMSTIVASQLTRVLSFAIKRMKRLLPDGSFEGEAIGKTGTNNDCRTCWFCGATPDLTTALYVGCDNNQSLGEQVYGSRAAFPIWFKMHQKIAKIKTNFYYDPQLRNVYIDCLTGKESRDIHNPNVVALLA